MDDEEEDDIGKAGRFDLLKRKDRTLIREAISKGAEIPATLQKSLIEAAERILENRELSPRELSSLGSMLTAWRRTNLEEDKARLGIDDSRQETTLNIQIVNEKGKEGAVGDALRKDYNP